MHYTIIFISDTKKDSSTIMKQCLDNKVSFEFLNGNEFYFTIYDDEDFERKRKVLGEYVISEKNKAK